VASVRWPGLRASGGKRRAVGGCADLDDTRLSCARRLWRSGVAEAQGDSLPDANRAGCSVTAGGARALVDHARARAAWHALISYSGARSRATLAARLQQEPNKPNHSFGAARPPQGVSERPLRHARLPHLDAERRGREFELAALTAGGPRRGSACCGAIDASGKGPLARPLPSCGCGHSCALRRQLGRSRPPHVRRRAAAALHCPSARLAVDGPPHRAPLLSARGYHLSFTVGPSLAAP
jgi:hypothetical protein